MALVDSLRRLVLWYSVCSLFLMYGVERRHRMSLIEYLYVDEHRLNSYFEQFSPPVTYDKVSVWKTILGLTGPKVEAVQNREARPFTMHEKIVALVKYLEKEDLLDTNRPKFDKSSESVKEFRFETCQAMSMFIPPRTNHSFNSRGLHLWFSSSSWIGRRVLYLMEDFSREPQDPSCLGSGSAYQILQWIVRDLLHSKLLRSNNRHYRK
jgi:hypothetical protein